jgi:hypothetical protein
LNPCCRNENPITLGFPLAFLNPASDTIRQIPEESDTEQPSNVPMSAGLFWESRKYTLTPGEYPDRLDSSPVDATEGKEEMKIIGINDDVTTCECCGRSNLKCTVVLSNGESEVHYGRDCAAKALAGKFGHPKTAYRIEGEARSIQSGFRPVVREVKPFFYPNGVR